MSRVECFNPYCHCSFASQASMLQHYKDRHVPQDQQLIEDIECNDCGKSFPSTVSLHQHQWDSADHTRVSKPRLSKHDPLVRACSQCGDNFGSDDDLEDHFIAQHRLIEITESSEERRTWQLVAERFISTCKLHRIFKVYNTATRRKDFEEYRKELKKEMNNKKLVKEDNLELRTQVRQDGNEMLRVAHGTTVKCRLGRPAGEGSAQKETTTSLCASGECNLCSILQKGFKKSKCKEGFGKGIYFSSISSKASGYVKGSRRDDKENYKVMMLCKVLVGRPHIHSTRNFELEVEGPPMGYHSVLLGSDPGVDLNYDELVVYDDRAILPAFIILYSATSHSGPTISACEHFLSFLLLFILIVCVLCAASEEFKVRTLNFLEELQADFQAELEKNKR